DEVKPMSYRFLPLVGPCPAHQNQERGLKNILHIVAVVKEAAANMENHQPVPLHQHGERLRVALFGVAFQQFSIRQSIEFPLADQLADLIENQTQAVPRHWCHSETNSSPPIH